MSLPPTSTKVSGDANNVTTFNFLFPNFTGTHTGASLSLGVNSVVGGGTGLSAATTGDILYASATNTLSRLAIGSGGQYLSVAGGIPAWSGLNLGRTINAQSSTTYTLVLADGSAAGGNPLITLSNASAITCTVPPNSSVAFPIGTQVDAIQQGAGKVTFAQGAGVTINSLAGNKSINGQYVGVSLVKTATDTWTLMGNLTV